RCGLYIVADGASGFSRVCCVLRQPEGSILVAVANLERSAAARPSGDKRELAADRVHRRANIDVGLREERVQLVGGDASDVADIVRRDVAPFLALVGESECG